MLYIFLEDDISKLPLPKRVFNAMKRNGVNTIGEMILSKEDGKLADFAYLGKKGVSEIEQWVESLYTGDNGYLVAEDADEIAQRKSSDIAMGLKQITLTDCGCIKDLMQSHLKTNNAGKEEES